MVDNRLAAPPAALRCCALAEMFERAAPSYAESDVAGRAAPGGPGGTRQPPGRGPTQGYAESVRCRGPAARGRAPPECAQSN
eukprot:SAG31_NODE_7552_length_1657_cov_1.492940_2_plen_82_part_00